MSIVNGNYICRQCGAGDGFSLIMKVSDCSFIEAVEMVGQYLGITRQGYSNPIHFEENIELRRLEKDRYLKEAAAEKHRQEAVAAQRAVRLWNSASLANSEHPYLIRKQLPALGLKQSGNNLLIPLYAHDHELVNIEQINSCGKKFGLKNGKRKDVYYRFGQESWTVYICEGWATGASLYLMEGQTIQVYSAMGKGNLTAISYIAKEQNPDSRLILAADNDTHLSGNPGLKDALHAAEAVGATVMMPPAISTQHRGTDFSDFYLANGGHAYGTL